MVPFKDSVKITRDIIIIVILIMVVIFWVRGREEVIVETESFVPAVVDISPPPPTVVEFHSDGDTKVKIDTVNINPVFEHHDHHVLVEETVIIKPPEPVRVVEEPIPEPIKQSPLIQRRDMRAPQERSSVHYYGGYSSGMSYHHYNSGGWNLRNAPVRTPNPPGCGFNTQGCR